MNSGLLSDADDERKMGSVSAGLLTATFVETVVTTDDGRKGSHTQEIPTVIVDKDRPQTQGGDGGDAPESTDIPTTIPEKPATDYRTVDDFFKHLQERFDGNIEEIPGEEIIALLENTNPELLERLRPHLMDDGNLDRTEMVRALSELGYEHNEHDPDPDVVARAQEFLARNGIEDPEGTIAIGLAKASVVGTLRDNMLGMGVVFDLGIELSAPPMPAPPTGTQLDGQEITTSVIQNNSTFSV